MDKPISPFPPLASNFSLRSGGGLTFILLTKDATVLNAAWCSIHTYVDVDGRTVGISKIEYQIGTNLNRTF